MGTSGALAAKQMSFEFLRDCLGGQYDDVRRSTGRLFHVAGPDTAKSLRPIVVLVCGYTIYLLNR